MSNILYLPSIFRAYLIMCVAERSEKVKVFLYLRVALRCWSARGRETEKWRLGDWRKPVLHHHHRYSSEGLTSSWWVPTCSRLTCAIMFPKVWRDLQGEGFHLSCGPSSQFQFVNQVVQHWNSMPTVHTPICCAQSSNLAYRTACFPEQDTWKFHTEYDVIGVFTHLHISSRLRPL